MNSVYVFPQPQINTTNYQTRFEHKKQPNIHNSCISCCRSLEGTRKILKLKLHNVQLSVNKLQDAT